MVSLLLVEAVRIFIQAIGIQAIGIPAHHINMAFEATDILGLMLFLTWACISVPFHVTPRVKMIIPSEANLIELFGLIGFTFCPGLYDILQAATAPSLAWFESLPADIPKEAWGVYLLILKKPGHRHKIYIGSGTGAYRGLRARLAEHGGSNESSGAKHVKAALQDGYRITHKRVLASAPIPTPGLRPMLKVVVIALEATFTGLFWALVRRDKHYGFGDLCPWPKDTLEWDGLCSHNPLVMDIIGADYDFTPEELKELAAALKEKKRLYQLDYHRALRADPPPGFRERQHRNNELQRPATKARQEAAVLAQKYHCPICNVSTRDAATLKRHNGTARHLRMVAQGGGPPACDPCNMEFKFPSELKAHEKTQAHQAMVKSSSGST